MSQVSGITLVGLLIATVGLIISLYNMRMVRSKWRYEIEALRLDARYRGELQKGEMFLKLNNSLRRIQEHFGNEVNSPDWTPTSDEFRWVTLYWYGVFDIWVVCRYNTAIYREIWDEYYSKSVKSALRIPVFRSRITDMFSGEAGFMGHRDQFYKAVTEAYEKELL
jgi:hypothetical protein